MFTLLPSRLYGQESEKEREKVHAKVSGGVEVFAVAHIYTSFDDTFVQVTDRGRGTAEVQVRAELRSATIRDLQDAKG